ERSCLTPWMEVVVHYRPSLFQQEELHKITAGALEDFPVRHLLPFLPWFPCCLQSFALKPQLCPPFISEEDVLDLSLPPANPEYVGSSKTYDCTVDLLEFMPSVGKKKEDQCDKVIITREETFINEQAADPGRPEYRRSWSISTVRGNQPGTIMPLSEELKVHLNQLVLYPLHRGWWTIVPSICNGHNIEEAWIKLNGLIRHHLLPSCHATMQRDTSQIWIFCDLQYCEHTALCLKKELNLTGKMDLRVRKHGVILSL
uniref:Shieldin complex subunit 3 n=1 Tax=Leptobrachium leishanense TaxID=445787 RepID=A0A8C5M072_9ANUR